jgi:HEAT repeat protein
MFRMTVRWAILIMISLRVCWAGTGPLRAEGQTTQKESAAEQTDPPKVKEARSLGQFGGLRNVQRLLKLMRDPDERVRAAAAEALSFILRQYATTDPTKGNEDPHPVEYLHYKIIAPFEVLGYRSALLHALSDPSSRVRASALKALGAIFVSAGGSKAEAPSDLTRGILPLLKDADDDVASAAAEAVLLIEIREAVPGLMKLLERPNRDVRLKALDALNWGSVGDQTKATPFVCLQTDSASLVRLLRDPDPELRELGSSNLARMCRAGLCGTSAVPPLLEALQDAQTRLGAVESLLYLKDPNTVEPVLATLKEDASQDGETLRQILRTDLDLPFFMDFAGHDRAVELVLGYLKNGSPKTRAIVTVTLLQLKDERALPALIETLNDPAPAVRRLAVEELGQVSDPRVIPSLIEKLQDPDDEVVLNCSKILESRRDPRALKPLIDLLHRDNPEIQGRIIDGLSKFRDPSVIDALAAIVEDRSSQVRGRAATSLCEADDPRGLAAVRLYYDGIPDKQLNLYSGYYRVCIAKLQAASLK